jgi:alpha-glucosidase (family GH31 glycosyl hydrolase)
VAIPPPEQRALTWPNLAYQSYFSATASNVGFGFWSHDVEGPGNDHEMYARWLQLA